MMMMVMRMMMMIMIMCQVVVTMRTIKTEWHTRYETVLKQTEANDTVCCGLGRRPSLERRVIDPRWDFIPHICSRTGCGFSGNTR